MSDLIVHLARFAGALRDAGVRVSLGDEADALQALTRVDVGDRDEVRWALRCALRIRRPDAPIFEALFARLWEARAGEEALEPPASRQGPSVPRAALGLPFTAPGAAGAEVEVPQGEEPGYSREALFRRKPFDECDERDLAAMERLLIRLAGQLATRRSRRLAPTHGRGQADLRRSFRRAVATGGELISLALRARSIETLRLVLLCDTSGSMEGHTRFLLAFARALRRVAERTEVFAFNTELKRITPWLSSARQEVVLSRLAMAVPDWSGGTRIGESFDTFVARHLNELVDARTVVIVFSDGLDRGDTDLLAEAMRRIRARARRVIWLNPLLSDPRYEPTARGMAAALPFVDHFAPAHNLESLARVLPHLRA